jgi:hypothetical protein
MVVSGFMWKRLLSRGLYKLRQGSIYKLCDAKS